MVINAVRRVSSSVLIVKACEEIREGRLHDQLYLSSGMIRGVGPVYAKSSIGPANDDNAEKIALT